MVDFQEAQIDGDLLDCSYSATWNLVPLFQCHFQEVDLCDSSEHLVDGAWPGSDEGRNSEGHRAVGVALAFGWECT